MLESEDGDVDSYFDSQRQTKQENRPEHDQHGNENDRKMIVRVIVTSSSSSSSSTSSQEVPDYPDATFTDFEFPLDSNSKLKPKVTTTSTELPSSPVPEEKKEVEDIFSAFYKAFNHKTKQHQHNPISDASHNVERFELFYPTTSSTSVNVPSLQRDYGTRTTTTTTPSIFHYNNDGDLTVVKAVSSSSSSSSPYFKTRNNPSRTSPRISSPQSWVPTTEKVAAVKSVSKSSTTHGFHFPYSNSNSNPNENPTFHYTSTTTTTTTEPDLTFRTTSRRRQQRQRSRQNSNYNNHPAEVLVSVSSSISSDNDDSSNHPQALPFVQYQSSRITTTTSTTTTTTPKPQESWQPQVWGEPAKVWGEPAKVWGEPAKVWGEPAKVWGVPELNWGHSPSSTSTTSKPFPTTRKPRYINHTTKFQKYTTTATPPSSQDEDYPRDEEAVEHEPGGEGGTFVVLGEEDPEQDSIDGSFDHHLGLPPVSPRPISLDQFKTFNFSYHHNFQHLNLSSLTNNQTDSRFNNNNNDNYSPSLQISSESGDGDESQNSENSDGTKFGYVLEGSNVRRYRVEERTPDGYIVGEYGVLNNQNAFLRGVRYTADGTINPRVIHEALMKFLSLRR